MATTGVETVRDIVQDALLDIGAATMGQAPYAEEMAHGVRHLNRLMKTWADLGYLQSLVTSQSVTLIAATAAHTLSPVRPTRIINARYTDTSGTQIPMMEMTRQEYDALPVKTSTGIPTSYYYDKQKESAVLYVWPLKATVTTETIEVTYEREFEDISDEDDTIDLPAEGYDAAVSNLASRLSHTYGSAEKKQFIHIRAKNALDKWLAADTETIVRPYG